MDFLYPLLPRNVELDPFFTSKYYDGQDELVHSYEMPFSCLSKTTADKNGKIKELDLVESDVCTDLSDSKNTTSLVVGKANQRNFEFKDGATKCSIRLKIAIGSSSGEHQPPAQIYSFRSSRSLLEEGRRFTYYEVKIDNMFPFSQIYMGFALMPSFVWNKTPGSYSGSYGLNVCSKSFLGLDRYGMVVEGVWPNIEADAVIGCGYDRLLNRIFYTHNRKIFDLACQDLSPGDFHAAASLRFNDEALSFNFTGPFQFDLEKHEADLVQGILPMIRTPAQYPVYLSLLLDYFAFNCLMESCKAVSTMASALYGTPISSTLEKSLVFRHRIKRLILAGMIEDARQLIERQRFKETSHGCLAKCMMLLICQELIELHASKGLEKRDLGSSIRAVYLAKIAPLLQNVELTRTERDYIEKCTTLLCSSKTSESDFWYLFTQEHRQRIADRLNVHLINLFQTSSSTSTTMILQPKLAKLLKQTIYTTASLVRKDAKDSLPKNVNHDAIHVCKGILQKV